jgi:hypothetical protein
VTLHHVTWETLISTSISRTYLPINKVRSSKMLISSRNIVRTSTEGHCDQRGSIKYNLALGDKRANGLTEVAADVSSANIKTISSGKEKPVCEEYDESCWQQNRHCNPNHENYFQMLSRHGFRSETPPERRCSVRD